MSRIIDILTAIQNSSKYDKETYSRAEAILKAIANDTGYSEIKQSRYEELLLAIKTGEGTTIIPQTRLERILVAIANDGSIPTEYYSEIEKAYINAADALHPSETVVEQVGDTVKVIKAKARQDGEVVYLL